MGKFCYWMNVSLDGYIDAVPGENGGGDWMSIDDVLHREFNARARALEASIEGRKIYEIMEPYWPAAAQDADADPVMREYGEIWTNARKYLVSNTRREASHNTTIISGDDVMEQLARIRAEATGVVGVGGATLATSLLEHGLLDELLLFVHPALLGSGRPLFDRLERPLQLELLETGAYGHGVVLHRYAIRSGAE